MIITDSGLAYLARRNSGSPLAAGAHGASAHPMGYEDLRVRMAEAGVDRAILIPPSWEGERADCSRRRLQNIQTKFAVMGACRSTGRRREPCWKPGSSSAACWACG